jgi:organic radical activating enzyme
MSIDQYENIVMKWNSKVKKAILIGGEPLLHPLLPYFIKFNEWHNLVTTVYTNGTNLNKLENFNFDFTRVNLRVGVLGWDRHEKNLMEVCSTKLPIGVVLMLRKDNVDQLELISNNVLERFPNLRYLMLSTIREVDVIGSFFKDTENTLSNEEFRKIILNFMRTPKSFDVHVCGRTVFSSVHHYRKCRYINVFPDGTYITCPFDISLRLKKSLWSFSIVNVASILSVYFKK